MSRSVLQVLRDAALRAAAYSEEGFRRGQVTLDAVCNKADAVDDAIATVERMAKAMTEAKAAMDSIWATRGHDDDWIYDEMGSELSGGYFALREALRAYRGEQA